MNRDTVDPTNVLLRARAGSPSDDATCVDLLTTDEPTSRAVLHVTLEQSPDERLAAWRAHAGGGAPARSGVIAAGDDVRSASADATTQLGGDIGPTPTVTVLPDRTDLAALRTAIAEYLDGWSAEPVQIGVCFHSLTALLAHADLDPVVRLVRSVTEQVATVGGSSHFHLDGAGLDRRTNRLLESYFDTVVEPDQPGAAVASRPNGRGTEDAPSSVFRTRIDDDELPSDAIVRGVASIEGVDPTDLDVPLFEAIDADELDALLDSADRPAAGPIRVEFSYAGYRVAASETAVTLRREPP